MIRGQNYAIVKAKENRVERTTHLPINLFRIIWIVLLPLSVDIIFDVAALRERNPALQFRHINEFIFVLVDLINNYAAMKREEIEP